MADDQPLPKLSWNPSTDLLYTGPRKRVRLSSPAISSDPVFSSDDDPSADNYTQERRKRKFRGPWFRQQPESETGMQDIDERDPSKKTKRPFERQFDSGVFMGSDGTDMGDLLEDADAGIEALLPVRPRGSQASKLAPTPDEVARGYIESCLDPGIETIDLSSRNLTTLSSATIRPLAAFTRVPTNTDVFFRLEPKLKLFLSSNSLTTLPGELFNLEHLTVLSLRSNEIRELPSSIGKLTRLKELNLSQNKLRYLPYEILELLKDTSDLGILLLHPNPFHPPQKPTKPTQAEDTVQYKIGLGRPTRKRQPRLHPSTFSWTNNATPWQRQWLVNYQTRSDVRYLSITGKLVKGPAFTDIEAARSETFTDSIPVVEAEDTPKPPVTSRELSRVPSLLEVSLTACSKTPRLPMLGSLLPADSGPYLPKLLADATVKKFSGGSKCTICKRDFIIARTEWIEWWEIAKRTNSQIAAMSAASPLRQMENERDALESMVPLIRRGCSWLCVPERLMYVEEDVES